MEESKRNSKNKFLKEELRNDISKQHKTYLGTDIPSDYFSKSKASILDKIKSDELESNFLREDFSNTTAHHQSYLGTAIPSDYFSKSKASILNTIKDIEPEVNPKKQKVFYLQPRFRYAVAASLLFILSLTIWLQNSNTNTNPDLNLESLALTDDVLVASLLVEDNEIDAFTESTLFEEVVVKAEEKEQKLDDLILDAIIVEDSLLDNYIKNELIETIVL